MSNKAIYTSASFKTSGGVSVGAGATVEVRREDTGALASLFTDEAGTVGLINPFTADSNGNFAFYVAGIKRGFMITVTAGAEVHILRNQAVGTAGQVDIENYMEPLLLCSTIDAVHSFIDQDVEDRAADTPLALADWGKTINFTASFTQTISSGLPNGWWVHLRNSNSGLSNDMIITPTGGELVNERAFTRIQSGGSVIIARTGTAAKEFKTIGDTVPAIRDYINGFTIANGTDAVNDIDVTGGVCMDSTNAIYMNRSVSGLSGKQLDAAWAVGSNAGMRDTGAIADATWHIFAIQKDADGTLDFLASQSATAPTMPSGYTYFRRIGSIIRSGATILGFTQVGDEFLLNSPVQDYAANNPGTSAVSRTLTVPNGIQVKAIHTFSVYTNDVTTTSPYGYISSLDQTNVAASVSAFTVRAGGGGSAGDDAMDSSVVRVRTSTGKNVRTRLDASSASVTVYGITHGWEDRRGKT